MRNILLLLILLLPGIASATQMIMLRPNGPVEVKTGPAATWAPVMKNTELPTGAEVRTGKAAAAEIYFPDGTKFVLSESSTFAVEEVNRKKAGFRLLAGRLKAAVAGYFASRFEVRTPAAVCAVRGTQFDVVVDKSGNTEMSVAEGLVEVNDNKGQTAVVSSEERIKVGAAGMTRPESISLTDARAGLAARPMAVRQETARERTRTMIEELRNRELKANEAQLGKDSTDAFGKRVRIEEYLLRPADNEFKLLFLSKRAEAQLDWGSLQETFKSKIPDDISQVGDIISGMYFSEAAPSNWLKTFEVYLTNTTDAIKENIVFGDPVLINFAGYGVGSRYYPGTIDYTQTLSGPGVPGGERIQFRQIQDFNVSNAGMFTWTQKVVNGVGVLQDMYVVGLDPTDSADVAAEGHQLAYNPAIDVNTTEAFPSGPGKADYLVSTTYADGSTVSSRKMLVSNDGDILATPGMAGSSTFLKDGSYNLEMVVASSLFQGRNIDVLLAPEILNQKKDAVNNPGTTNLK